MRAASVNGSHVVFRSHVSASGCHENATHAGSLRHSLTHSTSVVPEWDCRMLPGQSESDMMLNWLTSAEKKTYRQQQRRQIWCRYHRWTGMYFVMCPFNPLTAKLFSLNFHPLEVVSRWRDPQLQVSENYSNLTNWRSTLFKSCWLISHFIFNIFKMWNLMC